MFKAKNFWVILTVTYWFLAFFYLISDDLFPNYKVPAILKSYILPYRYQMYTSPPGSEPKLTFVWYQNDSVLKAISPQDSLYKKWQNKPISLESKLLSNQVLGLYARPLSLAKNIYQEIYLEKYRTHPRWQISKQVKESKTWLDAKKNWLAIAKQQVNNNPRLQQSTSLILYFYIIPYKINEDHLKLNKNFLPEGLVADTIKISEL